jgi:hypothetical protein
MPRQQALPQPAQLSDCELKRHGDCYPNPACQ